MDQALDHARPTGCKRVTTTWYARGLSGLGVLAAGFVWRAIIRATRNR